MATIKRKIKIHLLETVAWPNLWGVLLSAFHWDSQIWKMSLLIWNWLKVDKAPKSFEPGEYLFFSKICIFYTKLHVMWSQVAPSWKVSQLDLQLYKISFLSLSNYITFSIGSFGSSNISSSSFLCLKSSLGNPNFFSSLFNSSLSGFHFFAPTSVWTMPKQRERITTK